MLEKLERRVYLSGDAADVVRTSSTDVPTEVVSATPEVQPVRRVVAIDAALAAEELSVLDDPATRVVLLTGDDPLGQIGAALHGLRGVSAVHVITHGRSGALALDGRLVDEVTLESAADELNAWSDALADDASILLYGCDVGAGETGSAFLKALARRTDATVAASDDPTGHANDWHLEQIVGDTAEVEAVEGIETLVDLSRFSGLLAAPTVSAVDSVGHLVGTGPQVLDNALTVSGAGTFNRIDVQVTAGYRNGEDILSATNTGVGTGLFDATTGTLSITGLANNASTLQSILRSVRYENAQSPYATLGARTLTIRIDNVAVETVTVTQDLPLDASIRQRLNEAATLIQDIGTRISGFSAPGQSETAIVPLINETIGTLLYPTNSDGSTNYTSSIQPTQIGDYLQVKSAVSSYLTANPTLTDVTGLVTALQTQLTTLTAGTTADIEVTGNFVKPSASNARRIDLVLKAQNVKGFTKSLDLPELQRDLGLTINTAPSVTVGGGADIEVRVSLELDAHTWGSTLPTNKVGVNFAKLAAQAGVSTNDFDAPMQLGVIGGTITDGSIASVGQYPVSFSGGASKTLDNWNATAATGFGTLTGTVTADLPISASIGGVAATSTGTKLTISSTDPFGDDPLVYSTSQFGSLQYFAALTVDDLIRGIQDVGQLYHALDASNTDLLGLPVPLTDATSFGDALKFGELFDDAIGSKIDVVEPIMSLARTDELTDYRLPLSDDSTPKPAEWSDLRGAFSFGVVTSIDGTATTVNVAADGTRTNFTDLLTDINAALTSAGVPLVASGTDALTFKGTSNAVKWFALVPAAPPAERAAPLPQTTALSTLANDTPRYISVTGTTSGSVVGTNFYKLDTPIAAAAVHAGLVANGETAVVKVTRKNGHAGFGGSNRNGINSAGHGSADGYLLESAAPDLVRLGVLPVGESIGVLDTFASNRIKGTLPMATNLPSDISFKINDGSNDFAVTVADNNRGSVTDTIADVNAALVAAGIPATTLVAEFEDDRLVLRLPTGSPWSSFSVEPTSDVNAHQPVSLGLMVGGIADRPRPVALQTIDDFTTPGMFDGLSVTPIYDKAAGTVTFELAAADTPTAALPVGVDFATLPLTNIRSNSPVTVSPTIGRSLDFGVAFRITPAEPIVIASAPVTSNVLTADATFDLDFALQQRNTVTIPHGWTTGNDHVQALIGDANQALQQAGLDGKLIARHGINDGQFELVTAYRTNGNSAITLTHTAGVLASDLSFTFTHDGTTHTVTVAAADTATNTSLGQLVRQINAALADVGDPTLVQDVFFTTFSTSTGAQTNEIYVYAVNPPDVGWPTQLRLINSTTNPAATVFGFNDGAGAAESTLTARTGIAAPTVKAHTNGRPFADGTLQLSDASFAGAADYGLNTLRFTGTDADLDARVTLALPTPTSLTGFSPTLVSDFTRTVTGSDGTGKGTAALALTGITRNDLAAGDDDIADGATVTVSIADIADRTVTKSVAEGAPIAIPGQSAGKFKTATGAHTLYFIHDDIRYGATVNKADTQSNTTFAQLATQYNAALTSATRFNADDTTTVIDASSLFTLTKDPDTTLVQLGVYQPVANPNYASVAFGPNNAAFGEAGLQGAFGLGVIEQALTDVLPVLDTVQDELTLFNGFDVPLVDRPVRDLIDVKGDLLTGIARLGSATASNIADLAPAIAAALDIPSSTVALGFDSANNSYRLDLTYTTAAASARSLSMTLADFYRFTGQDVPDALSVFNDMSQSSPLETRLVATTQLSLGIDLTDPNAPRTFLYGHDGTNGTRVNVGIEAVVDDVNFTAAAGALGIFVRNGRVHLAGPAVTNDDAPVYTHDSGTEQLDLQTTGNTATLTADLAVGRHYLTPTGSETAPTAEQFSADFAGSVEAHLPLFTPTEFIDPFTDTDVDVQIQGSGEQTVELAGNVFTIVVPDLGDFADASELLESYRSQISAVYAAADDDPLTPAQQAQVDALQASIDGLATGEAVSIYAPDLDAATSGENTPTLLDALRDPALLLDGIDVILGTVESGLRGLDSLNIPVIGPVLGDAVDGVFDWRSGWLEDLRYDLRGQGDAFFQSLKESVYDFLGPAGIDLLLKDNGISSVEGLVGADSVDDVVLDFFDADGKKLTGRGGYGADSFEFKVRLGQTLLDTGLDLSFDFDSLAPAFQLGIDGGLSFKLGWDLTVGFGYSLTDGFYVVTNSDDAYNELQLQFEAGLTGRQTGFTVASRASSITGYSIRDAAGLWVHGPADGNGNTSILDVMPVLSDGTDWSATGTPTLPQDCVHDGSAEPGSDEMPFWVVAVDNGSGTAVPAQLDFLGRYVPQTGSRDTTQMVRFDQTAPFAAFGSLFFFNLAATDTVRVGLDPLGNGDYFYDPSQASTTTPFGRNDGDYGVNRNNDLPTRVAGRIGVNVVDPSTASGDYLARPGASPTGFVLMDGSDPVSGGEPVLDDDGNFTPVIYESGTWYIAEEDEGTWVSSGDEITADATPNRITFEEISEAGLDLFELDVSAEAVVNLDVEFFVSENAAIPRLTGTLNVDWRSDSVKVNPDGSEKRDFVPEIGINDIRLDLGSFLNKFIKPIAVEADKAFKPVDPLIDVVNSKIPVLSDIAGRNVRLTDLLTQFGGPKGKAVAAVIDTITLVRDLSAVMAAVPDNANVYLPIGNFWLAKVPGGKMQIYYDNSEVRAPSITQRNQSLLQDPGAGADAATNALGKLDEADRKERSNNNSKFGSATDPGGFDIPILKDPTTIFRLLMGEDVPLVTFSLPSVDFVFDKRITLARILVLEIGLRINVELEAQLHMGYDTKGLRLFADSRDPGDLLEGFYISDRENADGTGADVDEFSFSASLGLYGGVDAYLARAGIEGGFNFNARINLNDPDNDGKLRVLEAIELVEYTGNPLDLADLHFSGEVYARYYYWVGLRIWTPWKSYTITLHRGGKTFARATVFSFTRGGNDGPPVFASKITAVDDAGNETPNTLLLHMGGAAEKRVSNQDPLKLRDGNEHFTVWNDAGNPSTVNVRYNTFSGTETQTFTGVARVVASGDEGNDTIDASGLSGISVDFDGGAGNDTISLNTAPTATLTGGSGNDDLRVNGSAAATLDGGGGNDTLRGGTGTNDFRPGGGNDTVHGGAAGSFNTVRFARTFGVDQLLLNGNATSNLISFVESTLPVTANLSGNNSTVSAGDNNKATFDLLAVTEIHGSRGRDVFNVTNPTTRSRTDNEGLVLRGGLGNDEYNLVADDVTNVNAEGIRIDDAILPTTPATVGTIDVDGTCGHLKKIEVATGGTGYVVAPEVRITDATGRGAKAVASIDDNGVVTGIHVIDPGEGYSATPSVTLLDRTSRDDSVTFSSTTTGDVVFDRNASINRLTTGGKSIRFAGYANPGTPRPSNAPAEIDDVSLNIPAGSVRLASAIDVRQTLEIDAKHVEQEAALHADTVRITTAQGFNADHAIHATNNGDVLLRVTGQYPDAVTEATATATVVDGVITALNLTAGGSGYTHTPVVTIVDPIGNGTGARATATLTNGVVTALTLLDGGSGYFATPAPIIKFAAHDSIRLDAHVTSSTVGSIAGSGDGRGTITLRSEGGAIHQSGDVDFGSSNLDWRHGDFAYANVQNPDTLDDLTGGGSGATATAVVDADGQVTAINVTNGGSGYSTEFLPSVQLEGGATATAIVDDGTGTITGFRITYPGNGYAQSNPPAVNIVSNGFARLSGPATNRAHIQAAGGSLVASAVTGIGDAHKPLKTDVETMVAHTTALEAAIYVLEKDGTRLGLLDSINGVSTIDGDIAITNFTGTLALGQPVQAVDASGNLLWQDAAQTVPIYERDDQGRIVYRGGKIDSGDGGIKFVADDIDVNSFVGAGGGSIELSPVRPSAEIGLNGTQATVEATISGGVVTGFTNLWEGRGYTGEPIVTLTPPGQRAFGVADVRDGELQSVRLTFGGSNYNASFPPTVSLVGGNPDEAATVTATYNSDGQVTGFTVTDPGSGYGSAPEVRISLPGQQATARAVITGDRVTSLTIESPGANYQTPPTVEIGDPYPFSLKEAELDYFEDGFEEIIIGRIDGSHTFHSANATFTDGIRLRAPRGGTINVERLEATDSPVVIVGSGNTLNLDSANPIVSGTFIEVDDNIVVHDDVDAILRATAGHVSVFGAGKGKIDGVAGSLTENLLIEDVSDITVTGAIGSSYPIHNLTLNSSGRGNVSLERSVELEGTLTITEAGDVTFGGDVTIDGDLIITDADNVDFLGSLTVTGDIVVATAGRLSFAQDVEVQGNVDIGTDTDLTAVERVTFAANTLLDVRGNASIYTNDDIRLAIAEIIGDLNLATNDDVTVTGNMEVDGTLTLGVADKVSFARDLEVVGDVSIGNLGDLTQIGEITFAGGADIDVSGAMTLAVNDDIALENVEVVGNLAIHTNGALEVAGTIDTDADFVIGRAASVSLDQDVTVAGDATFGTTLDLTLLGTVALGETISFDVDGTAAIYANDEITLGALDIGTDLLVSTNAGLSVASDLSVDGNFTLGRATAASFARDVGIVGFVSLGSAVDPTRLGALSFASSARFDAGGLVTIYTQGDVVFGNRVGQLETPTSMLVRSEAGDISFNDTVDLDTAPLTIAQARDLTFAQDLTAGDLVVTLATGQTRFQRTAVLGSVDVTSVAAVQVVNQLVVTTGNLRLRTNDVDFNGGVNSIIHQAADTRTMTVEPYALDRAIAIGSPAGAGGLDISDLDLDAISGTFAELVIGTATTGTGPVTLGSIGTQQGAGNSRINNPTRIVGGSITVAQNVDSAAGAGYLKLVANTGDITVNGALNETPGERNDTIELLSHTGAIALNAPVYAGDELRLYAATTVTATSFIDADHLAVDAGAAVSLNHETNRVSVAAFDIADDNLVFRNDHDWAIGTVDSRVGLDIGTGDAHLTSNNATVTQTDDIVAADLRTDGTAGDFTLTRATNDVDTARGSADDVRLVDADDLNITAATTTGVLIATAADALTVGVIDATGNVALDAGTTFTSTDISSDANIAVTADDAFNSTRMSTLGSVQLDTPAAMVLDETIAGTTVTLTVGDTLTNSTRISAGSDIDINVTNAVTSNVIVAGGWVDIAAASLGAERITADGNAVALIGGDLDVTVTVAGNVDYTAGDNLVADDVTSAADVRLDATATIDSATAIVAAGNLAMVTDTGTITTNVIDADGTVITTAATAIGSTDLDAGGNVTLDAGTSITSGNLATDADLLATAVTSIDLGTTTTVNANLTSGTTLDSDNFTATGNVTIDITGALTSDELDAAGILLVTATDAADFTATTAGNADWTVTGALTNGTLDASGNVDIDADDTFTSTGVTAGGTVNIDVVGAFDSDTIDAEGDLDIIAGSTVDLDTTAGYDVDIRATGAMTSGSLTAAGSVVIDADASLTSSTLIAAGTVDITAENALNMQTTDAEGDLTIDAEAGVQLTNTDAANVDIDAVGNVTSGTLNAAGNVDLDADSFNSTTLTATGNATLTTAGLIDSGTIDVEGDLTANAGTTLDLDTTEANNVDLTAAGDLTNGTLAAVGNVVIDANATLTSTQLTATGTASITAEDALNAGTTDAEGDLTIDAEAGVQLADTAGANVDIDAVGNVTSGMLDAAGNVDLDADSFNSTTLTATGNAALTAVGLIDSGDIDVEGDLDISAGGTVDLDTTAGDNVDIDVAGQMTNGTLTAAGNVIVEADDILTSSVINAGGTATLNVVGDLDSHTIDAAGDLTVTAGASVDLTVTAGANVNLTAAGDLTNGALTATGNVIVDADQSVTSTNLIALGNATLTVDGPLNSTALDTDGDLDIDAGAGVQLGTTEAVNADIDAVGNVTSTTFDATGTVQLDADSVNSTTLDADDDVTIATVAGVVSDTLRTDADLAIDAGTTLTLATTESNNANLLSTGQLSSDSLTADGNVTADTDANMLAGTMTITGTADLDAGTDLQAINLSVTGNANVDAGNDADIARLSTLSVATVNAGRDGSFGELLADADLTVTAGRDITADKLSSGGNLTATATNSFDADRVTAAGNAVVNATDINSDTSIAVTNNATLTADETLTAKLVDVDGLADLDARTIAITELTAGTLDTDATTSVTATRLATTGNSTVDAGTTVDVDTLTADGAAAIDAGDDININTLRGNAGVDVDGAADVTLGTTNGSGIDIDADGAVLTDTTTATADLRIVAGTTLDGVSMTTASNASLSSGANLNVDNITATGDATIDSAAGVIVDELTANDADIDAVGSVELDRATTRDLNVDAGNALDSQRLIGRNVTLFADAGITNTDRIEATGDINAVSGTGGNYNTLQAGNDLTLDAGFWTTADAIRARHVDVDVTSTFATNTIDAAGTVDLDVTELDSERITAAETVDITTTGAIDSERIDANDLRIRGGGQTDLNVVRTNNNADIAVTGRTAITDAQVGGDATITATQNLSHDRLTVAGDAALSTPTTLSLNVTDVAGTLTLSGRTVGLAGATSTGNLALRATADAATLGDITATGQVSLVASALNLPDGFFIDADGDVAIDADTLGLGTDILTGGDVTLDADTQLTGYVGINARGSIELLGSIDGVQTLSVAAGGDVRFDAAVGTTDRLRRVMVVDAINVTIDAPLLTQRFDQFDGTGTTFVRDTLSTTHSRGLRINTGDIVVDAALGSRRRAVINLAADGGMRFTEDARLWSHGGINLTADAIEADNGAILAASNRRDFVITADRVSLPTATESVSGNADFLLQPRTIDGPTAIGVDGAAFGLRSAAGLSQYFAQVRVTGGEVTLGDIDLNVPLSVEASDDLTVEGSVTTHTQRGAIDLHAGGTVTVLGDVQIVRGGDLIVDADDIRVGSDDRVANITIPGSLLLGTRAVDSTTQVINPLTTLRANDILIGGIDQIEPAEVRITGNFYAGDDFNIYTTGNAIADRFRIVATNSLNIDADGDIRVSDGTGISRTQLPIFTANRDGNRTGRLEESFVFYNNPRNVRLAAEFENVSFGNGLNRNGFADVRIVNLDDVPAAAFARVALRASLDGTLDGSDVLLGWSSDVLEFAPNGSLRIRIEAGLPVDLPEGSYTLFAEVLSYAPDKDAFRNIATSTTRIAA
ncbi:MAG: DUF4347 domain-containing protein [Planctomycetota bacterium]